MYYYFWLGNGHILQYRIQIIVGSSEIFYVTDTKVFVCVRRATSRVRIPYTSHLCTLFEFRYRNLSACRRHRSLIPFLLSLYANTVPRACLSLQAPLYLSCLPYLSLRCLPHQTFSEFTDVTVSGTTFQSNSYAILPFTRAITRGSLAELTLSTRLVSSFN